MVTAALAAIPLLEPLIGAGMMAAILAGGAYLGKKAGELIGPEVREFVENLARSLAGLAPVASQPVTPALPWVPTAPEVIIPPAPVIAPTPAAVITPPAAAPPVTPLVFPAYVPTVLALEVGVPTSLLEWIQAAESAWLDQHRADVVSRQFYEAGLVLIERYNEAIRIGSRAGQNVLQMVNHRNVIEYEVGELKPRLETFEAAEAAAAIAAAQEKFQLEQLGAAREAAAAAAVAQAASEAGASIPGLGSIPMGTALSGAALATLAPMLANAFAKASHEVTRGCFATTGAALAASVFQGALPLVLPAAFMFNPELQKAAQGLAKTALETLYRPLEDMAPITPAKAPGVGINLFLQAVMMGAGAHLVSVAAEASAPLKNMGLGYLSAFMADMAGFSRIATAYQGAMIQWGLAQPMRYWALSKFLPMIPNERSLMDLAAEYVITPEEFHRNMLFHGYPHDWSTKLLDVAHRPLGSFDFRLLAEQGELNPELIERELKHRGYSPEIIPALARALGRHALGELKAIQLGIAQKRYREGWDNEAALASNLQTLGVSPVMLPKYMYASRLDRDYDNKADLLANLRLAYRKGLLDDTIFVGTLTGAGMSPEKAQSYLTNETIRMMGAPKKLTP